MIAMLLAGCFALAPVEDPPPDQAVLDAAGNHFDAGHYTAAAETLREGYEATGSDRLLFPLAQTERHTGRCAQAIEHFEMYIATDPPQADVEEAQEGIAACERLVSVIDVAMVHYRAKRFAEAAATLRERYDADGSPAYLFPLAQSERAAGQCEDAITHYRSFVETAPPRLDADAAHEGIAACEQFLDNPDPALLMGEPEPPPIDTPSPPARRWYLDPAGNTLVAIGIVAAGVGGGLLGAAAATRNGADGAGTEDDFAGIDRRQQNLTTAGIITLSVGATSLLVGVVRWAIVSRRARRGR